MSTTPISTAGLPPKRRARGLAALVLALAAAAPGCGRGDREAGEPPESGGTLRVAIFETIDFPSPVLVTAPTTQRLLEHVTPPLGTLDENLRVHLRLANHCVDTGNRLEFRLKPLRWEDGVPVTAHDLVLTARLLRDHRTRSPERRRMDLVIEVAAADDSTLVLRHDAPYGRRIQDALLMPIASHALPADADPRDIRAWPLTQRPLSCGPFRVAASGTRELVLERNDSSGLPPAYLDRVEVRTRDDVETVVAEFRSGALDVIDDLPADRVAELRGVRGSRLVALVGRSYTFLGWNLHDGRFADPAVRRAAAQAVDVPRIIREVLSGHGRPARGPLVPALGFVDTSAVLRHDPRAASRLLDGAGWRDSDGDGVRDRRGARLEFHLLVHSTEPLRIAIATAVARDLERIGMRAEVRDLDPREIAPRLTSHAFEAFMGRWYPNLGLDLDPVWRSESTDRQNFGGYSNARVDSLLGRLRHDLHPDERAAAMARLQAEVYADQPYLFLVQEPRLLLLSRRVRGARPQLGAPFWNLPEWWIPRRLQAAGAPAS